MNTSRTIVTGLTLIISSFASAFSTATPLTIRSATPEQIAKFGGTPLQVDRLQMQGQEDLIMKDVPLDVDRKVDLVLERINVLAPGAITQVAFVDDEGRTRNTTVPTLHVDCFQGYVDGDPDSHVFLAIGDHGANGWIERTGEQHVITTHPTDKWTAIYDLKTIEPGDMHWADFSCATKATSAPHAEPASTRSYQGDLSCLSLLMAVETDAEFASMYGGNLDAAQEYIQTLIGAVSSIYDRDIGIKVTISYSRLWSDANDPWSGSDSGAQLYQFQAYWESNMDFVNRHVAHFLSPRNLGGGVAFLSGVCTSNGYAVSGNLNGSFPTPLEDNNGANWDPMVVAHETGHNCGSGHTHDSYSPAIDGCGNNDCTDANLGTIMSYCHLCSGGLSNMAMQFHPRVKEVIIDFLATDLSCTLAGDGSGPSASSDIVETLGDDPVDIPVLQNDYTNDCSPPILNSWDETSLDGGQIELVDGDTVMGILRYTPPVGGPTAGGDFFNYEIRDSSGQLSSSAVLILSVPSRAPDAPVATEPGSTVAYYQLQDPQSLPDFSLLEPYLVEVVESIDFPSTNGNFAGSGLSNDFGVVFNGFIEVPEDDWYTLHTNSDDGSTLYIGDELVVSNDGLHGMQERSGTLALQAGRHAIRVEFFERGGGAGCIVSIEGGGLAKQVVSPSMWSYEVEVVGDANGDGEVNIIDLLQIIADWGPCPPLSCPSDLDGNLLVDVEDLLKVIAGW